MRSSTAEHCAGHGAEDDAGHGAEDGRARREFLAVDRGSLVRLVVTVLLGLAALVGPRLTPTAAQCTDSVEVPATVGTAVDFAPAPLDAPAPSATP